MARALRAVHHVQPARAKAAAAQQRLDAARQARILELGEAVEERGDERREDEQHQQVERHPGDPDVQPPQSAHLRHQPQDQYQQRQAERGGEHRLLREIDHEQLRSHAVETELRLDDEDAIQRQRQLQGCDQHHHAREERCAVPQALGVKHSSPLRREPVDESAEREREQHRCAEQHVDHPEPRLGDGVVGRLLMRGERNRLGKRARNCVAVRAHVVDLAQREPKARCGRKTQRDEEHPGKSVSHAMRE